MLKIGAPQMASVEASATHRFRGELLEHVRQTYPLYSKLPAATLARLLDAGLTRAMGYGFTHQQTLAQFIALMITVAPNFDLHPAAHAILTSSATPLERRLESLAERLPDRVWDDITQQASSVGWYLIEDASSLPPRSRLTLALLQAFQGTESEMNPEHVSREFDAAADAAARRGWQSEDELFVFAAAWLTYGSGFDRMGDKLAWVSDVFDPGSSVKTQVVLLRMRLALDRQLWT